MDAIIVTSIQFKYIIWFIKYVPINDERNTIVDQFIRKEDR